MKLKTYKVTLFFSDGATTERFVDITENTDKIKAFDKLIANTFDINGVYYSPRSLVKGIVEEND